MEPVPRAYFEASGIRGIRHSIAISSSVSASAGGAAATPGSASSAVSDMSQFCKRQPAACEVGGQAATAIGQRAQEGARKLYHIITDKKPDHTSSIDPADDAEAVVTSASPTDALTEEDMAIEWQMPRTPLAAK